MAVAVWTAVAVAISIGALALHEVGHMIAFRDAGIPIARAGLGLSMVAAAYAAADPAAALRDRADAVAAYVSPAAGPEVIDALPFRPSARCSDAGVIINLIAGPGSVSSGQSCEATGWPRRCWLRSRPSPGWHAGASSWRFPSPTCQRPR